MDSMEKIRSWWCIYCTYVGKAFTLNDAMRKVAVHVEENHINNEEGI